MHAICKMHLVYRAEDLFLVEFWVHPRHSRAGNDQGLAKDRASPEQRVLFTAQKQL